MTHSAVQIDVGSDRDCQQHHGCDADALIKPAHGVLLVEKSPLERFEIKRCLRLELQQLLQRTPLLGAELGNAGRFEPCRIRVSGTLALERMLAREQQIKNAAEGVKIILRLRALSR